MSTGRRTSRISGWAEALQQLEYRHNQAQQMGGTEALDKLGSRGKLNPRKRIGDLLDAGSFHEFGEFTQGMIRVFGRVDRMAPGDAVVCGWGTVQGRKVVVVADDGSITAGARGQAGMRKATYAVRLARQAKVPCILLQESSALRMQQQMGAQFANNRPRVNFWWRAGFVPTICSVMGTAVGAASFRALNADFTTMTANTGALALAGPPMVLGGIGETVSADELGGHELHSKTTGYVDVTADDDETNIAAIRRLLSFVPQNCCAPLPTLTTSDPVDRSCPELLDIVPTNPRKPYDMHRVVRAIVDDGDFFELKEQFAKSLLVGFARLNGHGVGILANQPMHMGGVLDARAARKATRFLQVCNAYRIPVVILQDQPGFMLGAQSEADGALREVVRLMNAVGELTSPVVSLIVRKAYGFSAQLLGAGRFTSVDYGAAWPSASISLAGPELAMNTLLSREQRAGAITEERRAELFDKYREMSRARHASRSFGIDDLIHPASTRTVLCRAVELALLRRDATVCACQSGVEPA